MQGGWVQSLVGKLRFCILQSQKEKKKFKHNLKKKIHTWVPLGNMLGSPGNSEAAPIQRLSGLEEELKPLFILCLLCPFPSTMGGKPSFYSLCKSDSRNFRAV